MCILFLAIDQHPRFPLIIAANRDEYFGRPSQSMHFWEDHPNILAGRDLSAGGSWLGVNRSGGFCAVTNFRTGNDFNPDARSRGELIPLFLDEDTRNSERSESNFTSTLLKSSNHYNPFNVVYGKPGSITVFCSQDNSHRSLKSGYHSLSNGFVDQQWPKMFSGVQQLMQLIDTGVDLEIKKLNNIMRDETKALDSELPDTGIDPAVEKHISSIFISGENYGTRTTSYLLYSSDEIRITEINYDSHKKVVGQKEFSLSIS